MNKIILAVGLLALPGCAGLTFNPEPRPDALTYRDVVPYVFVSVTKDCVWTAAIMALPGKERSVTLHSGYGTSNLSVSLSNGMITSVGQQTDTKIPETITSLSGLATSAAGLGRSGASPASPKPTVCRAAGYLYPVIDGVPDQNHGVSFAAQ